MRFTPCPREPGNPYNIQAWASETGRYQLQYNRVLYGYRVQLITPMPDWMLVCDYCAGASREWMELLHVLMQKILLPIPESIDRQQLAGLWPAYSVRPMARDEACQRQLIALAVGTQPPGPGLDLTDLTQATVDIEAHLEIEAYVQRAFGPEEAAAVTN